MGTVHSAVKTSAVQKFGEHAFTGGALSSCSALGENTQTLLHRTMSWIGKSTQKSRPIRASPCSRCFCVVLVQSVVFESYHIQGGTDRTGVPTKMMSVSATVRLRFRNRGTFFSLHVTGTPFTLSYDELTVASGEVVPAIFITLPCCRLFRFSSCIILPRQSCAARCVLLL
jgi:hypothetical protein